MEFEVQRYYLEDNRSHVETLTYVYGVDEDDSIDPRAVPLPEWLLVGAGAPETTRNAWFCYMVTDAAFDISGDEPIDHPRWNPVMRQTSRKGVTFVDEETYKAALGAELEMARGH